MTKKKQVLKEVKYSNQNHVAKMVAELEAGKTEVSIAQIKEVMKILGDLNHQNNDVFKFMASSAAKRAV